MLDQVDSTNSKNLFCSMEILFLGFEGLYKSLSKAFFVRALIAMVTSKRIAG